MTLHLLLLGALCAALSLPAQAQIVLRQGSNSPPGTVFFDHFQKFKATLERTTQGAIRVELNTNEPNELNLLSNLRRGRVECAGTSLQGAATVLPEVALLQLPYLFTSHRQVDHVYGALTDSYRRLFAARGLQLLHFGEVGFFSVFATMPIKAPADVAGVKLRATQSRVSQAWIQAIGAEPVVLAFGELLPALQTGLVKGGEASVVIYDLLFSKGAPHFLLTQHSFDSGVILCNKEWFDQLSPVHQQLVSAAWDRDGQVRDVRAQVERVLAGAAAKGVNVVRPSEAELAPWRAAGARAADEVMKTLSPEAARLREEIQRAVAAAPR